MNEKTFVALIVGVFVACLAGLSLYLEARGPALMMSLVSIGIFMLSAAAEISNEIHQHSESLHSDLETVSHSISYPPGENITITGNELGGDWSNLGGIKIVQEKPPSHLGHRP